jgi:hypothetical protein
MLSAALAMDELIEGTGVGYRDVAAAAALLLDPSWDGQASVPSLARAT